MSWVIIYLDLLLPAGSNGLPRGNNEADHFIPPYLAFLPVGFAMPPMSPLKRWALTLSRKRPTPPFHPYPPHTWTVYFLLHFPSCYQDSGLRSTVSYGARTFLPFSFNKYENRRPPCLLYSLFFVVVI